jgi:polyhydroxyalkanoate synthesis regulator phasin
MAKTGHQVSDIVDTLVGKYEVEREECRQKDPRSLGR